MTGDPAGSSAGGEQPKCTAVLTDGDECRHVLVKFSPSLTSLEGQRWADLLRCERLAPETVRAAGIDAAGSRILEADNRVFLEVDRFDRIGSLGRSSLFSLRSIDSEYIGVRDDWAKCARGLLRGGVNRYASGQPVVHSGAVKVLYAGAGVRHAADAVPADVRRNPSAGIRTASDGDGHRRRMAGRLAACASLLGQGRRGARSIRRIQPDMPRQSCCIAEPRSRATNHYQSHLRGDRRRRYLGKNVHDVRPCHAIEGFVKTKTIPTRSPPELPVSSRGRHGRFRQKCLL